MPGLPSNGLIARRETDSERWLGKTCILPHAYWRKRDGRLASPLVVGDWDFGLEAARMKV